MRTLLTILFLTVISSFSGQVNKYNDWFDFNLKGKPKQVTEVTIFSLTDNTSKELFDNSVNKVTTKDVYCFDSLGIIEKEFHKSILYLTGRWIINKYSSNNDSIIEVSHGYHGYFTKKYLDHNKYLMSEIGEQDTTKFIRDLNHRVIKKTIRGYYTDSGVNDTTLYEYNENGDVIIENEYQKHSFASFQSESPDTTIHYTYHYRYVYDAKINWIVKVCIANDSISTITQREIVY